MSPQEVINNLGSLQQARRAWTTRTSRPLIEQKLEEAQDARRGSARFKAEKAIEARRTCRPTCKAKLEQVADAQVKAKGRITRPTALLIDKSGSMARRHRAGQADRRDDLGRLREELYVYAFDTMAYPVERGRRRPGLAGSGRSPASPPAAARRCGVAVEAMRLKRQYVEQIILVTDEGENTPPLFVPTLQKYRAGAEGRPGRLLRPHARRATAAGGASAGRRASPVDVFQFSGDYYSLPNLVPLLSRPCKLELLMEIMEYPLPVRKPA